MSKVNISYKKLIFSFHLMIDNTLTDDEIKEAILPFNYDMKKLNEGKNLLDETEKTRNNQLMQLGLKLKCTAEFNAALDAAKKVTNSTRNVVSVHFKSDVEIKKILSSQSGNSFPSWVDNMNKFYNYILNNNTLIEKMLSVGYSKEKLNAEYDMIKDVINKKYLQTKAAGESLQLTADKDDKVNELYEWKEKFKTILKIALKDKPQKLEKLGIKV
jgi:hypothetical protein